MRTQIYFVAVLTLIAVLPGHRPKNIRRSLGALGLELDHAVGNLLPGLAQDQQHVELGAAPHAHEQHLVCALPGVEAALAQMRAAALGKLDRLRGGFERAVELHSAWGTFEWLLHDSLERGHRVGVTETL